MGKIILYCIVENNLDLQFITFDSLIHYPKVTFFIGFWIFGYRTYYGGRILGTFSLNGVRIYCVHCGTSFVDAVFPLQSPQAEHEPPDSEESCRGSWEQGAGAGCGGPGASVWVRAVHGGPGHPHHHRLRHPNLPHRAPAVQTVTHPELRMV